MTLRRARLPFLFACLGAATVHAQDTATLGRQFASSSPIVWEVRESVHPALGAIRFAYGKSLVETTAGKGKVYSRAYVSCPKGGRRVAIELTNMKAPDDPAGLKPKASPRLVCNRIATRGATKLVAEELPVPWETNEIGDMLARNLVTFPLRECVSIDVIQEVQVPAAWGTESARVVFEIPPYNREVDSVFAACGETTAYQGAAPVAPVVSVPPNVTPPPAPAAPAPAAAVVADTGSTPTGEAPAAKAKPAPSWQRARVTSRGATNVRASASLNSAVVVQLPPGSVVEVQRTENEWWRARGTGAARFEGYIRQDRLVFK
jgi:SH3 domain-containing protein